MLGNRITGPGYYPKRPTQTKVYSFGGEPWVLCLYTKEHLRVGRVQWIGSGRYYHRAAAVFDGIVSRWEVLNRAGILIASVDCTPQPTIGFEVALRNPTPAWKDLEPDIAKYWTFTPERP